MTSSAATLELPWDRRAFPTVGPCEAYLVGGSVRDLLLGRQPFDLDLAVAGDPAAFARRLAECAGGRLIPLGKPGLMLYRVLVLSRGRIVGEMRRGEVDVERLGLLMGGAEPADGAAA